MRHVWTLGLIAVLFAGCHIERWRYDEKVEQARLAGQDYPDTMPGMIRASSLPEADRWEYLAQLSSDDREFVDRAAQGGMFVIESSRLALAKSESRDAREVATSMITDHGVAHRVLSDLVHRKRAVLPTLLDPELQREVDNLRSRSGRSFDHRYHELMVKAHDESIRVFENAMHGADDLDLRVYAEATLPMLRRHRELLGQ
jgi:putative membrane protein